MHAYERFLNYVVVYTRSDENSDTVPTTARQLDLARMLAQELQQLGVADAAVDDFGYVYGHLPATAGRENDPMMGLLAHMDTADYEAAHVRPVLHRNYDGGEVALEGRVLTPELFPHLPNLKGKTLITASGDTLLGADDKAGIAEIMTLVERLQAEGLPHGPLAIAFTPDEEVGRGTAHFDKERFGAKFAYTVDGGPAGDIEYENFNACEARWEFTGVDVHPGEAKDVMVNALLVAMEANAMLPSAQTPRHTEGYEGFYHLIALEGDATSARMRYIVRDHDAASFACRKETLRHMEKILNERWGQGTARLELRDQYRNMAEVVLQHPQLIARAETATRKAGLTPVARPVRGGTDGARLSWMGIPCPNLGTGGYAFHGPMEHITAEDMDAVSEMLVSLATEAF